jgi:hypothetical protein
MNTFIYVVKAWAGLYILIKLLEFGGNKAEGYKYSNSYTYYIYYAITWIVALIVYGCILFPFSDEIF